MVLEDIRNRYAPMNRRSFLILSGFLGLGAASGTLIPSPSEAAKFDKDRFKISKTVAKIGTFVSITAVHSSKDQAQEAIARAFGEIDRLEHLFNRFDSGTAVAGLNQEGQIRGIPPELYEVIGRSLQYYTLSQGAFDITVKPVVDLFQEKLGGNKKQMPTTAELKAVLNLVGSDKIDVQKGTIRLKTSGMGITLDGIAKGYIVDRVSAVLVENGVKDHLINAGGDIRTMGEKPGKRPWTVAIEDPNKKNNYPDLIHLKNGAVATSGNYEVFYDREKMFHHIVDPSTGLSPLMSSSVSVVADTTMEADALSTTVFVMSPDSGKKFIETLPNCECLIVTGDNRQVKSLGWQSASA